MEQLPGTENPIRVDEIAGAEVWIAPEGAIFERCIVPLNPNDYAKYSVRRGKACGRILHRRKVVPAEGSRPERIYEDILVELEQTIHLYGSWSTARMTIPIRQFHVLLSIVDCLKIVNKVFDCSRPRTGKTSLRVRRP